MTKRVLGARAALLPPRPKAGVAVEVTSQRWKGLRQEARCSCLLLGACTLSFESCIKRKRMRFAHSAALRNIEIILEDLGES